MTNTAQPLELDPQDPPEAWVIRAPNGNVRMWTQAEALAKRRAADWGLEARLEPITPRDLDPAHPIRRAVCDIVAERQYQISRHGWSRDHDDTHVDGAIANAAADYASTGQQPISTSWAYGSKVVDKEPRRLQLIKAGALIIAEIERLDRLTDREGCKGCSHSGAPPIASVACCPDGRRHVPSASNPELPTAGKWLETFIADEEDGPAAGICIDLSDGSQIWSGECSNALLEEAAGRDESPDESGQFLMVAIKGRPTRVVAQVATVDDGIALARALANQQPIPLSAANSASKSFVDDVATRDAAVAYRARIACDILEGFTDGIDGDRLGELARWVTRGRALDDAALHRAFAAPWIAAEEEAGWEGDAGAEARQDIDRHTIAARMRGATSFTPDQLATIFARQNLLKAAATAVSAIRPSNWNDGEDQEQQEAWVALDEALK